jgi:hypothetical protein
MERISLVVRHVLGRLRAAVYVLFGLLVLYLVLFVGYAVWRVRQVELGWASSFESMESFAARFPKTATSSGARKLNELTQPLGINMLEETTRNSRLDAIGAFVNAEQLATDDAPRRASSDMKRFLAERARQIEAIESHLLAGSELEWERDLKAGFDQPTPGRLGHQYLQYVLLARALEESRQGNSVEADRSLEASWILNQSLVRRPELISQLAALFVAGAQDGVVRALPMPPVRWADRVTAKDLPRAFLRAFQAEAFLYTFSQGVKDVRGVQALNPLKMAGTSELLRMTTELLRDSDDPCTLDFPAITQAAEEAVPRWNSVARRAVSGIPRAWVGLASIRMVGELTRLVIEARRDPGDFARAHGSSMVSTICKSVSWVRTSAADGTATIAAKPARPFRDETRREWRFSFRPGQNSPSER